MTLDHALNDHLQWWGLRRFSSDSSYFQWKRETVSEEQLSELSRLAERKRTSGSTADDVAFYDLSAHPGWLPLLYSERYDYYLAVGAAIARRLGHAGTILDIGCGPGILTTFYARQHPGRTVVGIDRSQACIDIATERALSLGLKNVRFHCLDLARAPLPGTYDLIIASHALLQTESDPGIPSRSWTSFDRAQDPAAQADFEARTGLTPRLDALAGGLAPDGTLILFEKTHHLARRVAFQRALASRGFRLLEPPSVIGYRLVEEPVDDGPLFVLACVRAPGRRGATQDFDESPDLGHSPGPWQELYRSVGATARAISKRMPAKEAMASDQWSDPQLGAVQVEWGRAAGVLSYLYVSQGDRFAGLLIAGTAGSELVQAVFAKVSDPAARNARQFHEFTQAVWPGRAEQQDQEQAPLYENHLPSAQSVWEALIDRRTIKEVTNRAPGGREAHIEVGEACGLAYLYCANTFDQRQLVLMEPERFPLLEQHYEELARDARPA